MHTSVPKDSPLGEWVLSLKDEDRRSLLQLLTSGPRGPPESVGQSAADALNAHLQALPLDNLRAVLSQTSASLPPFVWQMLADPPSPYLRPGLLAAALLCLVLLGVSCLSTAHKQSLKRRRQYFKPAAAAEAFIAICSGALLWIGFWDFMDSYLVPVNWWAKLCMLLAGALGAIVTRTLYDEDKLHPLEEDTSVTELEDMAPALPDELSPRPRTLGVADERAPMMASSASWCFLHPPPFSCSRCSRALLATFAGLTMWVGLWDLLDAHLLPTLFDACVHEPSVGCGAVKLSLIAIGAFGLYLTRSLYGDTGGSGPVHFQRL